MQGHILYCKPRLPRQRELSKSLAILTEGEINIIFIFLSLPPSFAKGKTHLPCQREAILSVNATNHKKGKINGRQEKGSGSGKF